MTTCVYGGPADNADQIADDTDDQYLRNTITERMVSGNTLLGNNMTTFIYGECADQWSACCLC